MISTIEQIVIEYKRPLEVTLAGVPLLARVILASVEEFRPRVIIAGDWSEPYRQTVEAAVHRVSPQIVIDWSGADRPAFLTEALVPAGRILLITAHGLPAPELIGRLTATPPGRSIHVDEPDLVEGGVWLLTAKDYAALMHGQTFDATPLPAAPEEFCPISGPADIAQAEKWLFRRFGKSTDGIVSRYLNRPISTWFSRRLARTSITPNYLTLLTAAFALLMFVILRAGTPYLVALGCVLYHITSIVDGLDGEVARAKFLSSRWGASFDTAIDMITNVLFIVGLTLGLGKIYGPQYLYLGGLVAAMAMTAITLMAYVVWRGPKGGSFDVLQLAIRKRLAGTPIFLRLFGIANVILKRDFFALAFGLLGLAGYALAIPWLMAAGMTLWLAAIFLAAPLVIGADPRDILPDHLNGLPAAKIPPISGPQGK